MDKKPIDVIKIICACCSGILLTASFPEYGKDIVAWFALAPLLIAIRNLSLFDSFRIGFLTGLVHYLTLLYWFVPFLHTYGPFPVYLSIAILLLFSTYLTIYVALFTLALTGLCTTTTTLFVAAPILWVSLEYLRTFIFTGFPWELLGYSQYNTLHMIQISDIIGVYGVSYAIVLSNVFFSLFFQFLSKKRWRQSHIPGIHLPVYTVVFTGLVGVIWAYGELRINRLERMISHTQAKKVTVVQGNIDQTKKWDPAYQISTINKYLYLTHLEGRQKSDLVVWPETSMPFYFLHHPSLTGMVMKGIQKSGMDTIVASPSFEEQDHVARYYNRAFLVHANGSVADTYDKAHLVPFGEYVPIKKWLPFLGKMVEQVGDFSRGETGRTLEWRGHKLGMLICYELIFPYLSRAAANNGAELLINITNDAWYGKSSAPYQHFSMAVFRAVENRRALVRSANTGISGFIDPIGRIKAATPIFEEAVITMDVPMLQQATLYTRFGDFFAVICLTASILFIIRRFYHVFGIKTDH